MTRKSRLQRLRAQGKLLDEIMAWKREEVARERQERPLALLRALAATVPSPLDLEDVLRKPGVHLIAEVVRATPAHGLLSHHFDPATLARAYVKEGASAISVVTDARFFQGHLEHLTTVKEVVADLSTPIPVIARDFVFDPYQIWAARVAGADAVTLMAGILGDKALRQLLAEARKLGMAAIVMVSQEQELARALTAGARIIGISNRDPRTYTADLSITERLRPLVPPDVLVISVDGIHTVDDVRRAAATSVHALLVGAPFVRADPGERGARVRAFVEALR